MSPYNFFVKHCFLIVCLFSFSGAYSLLAAPQRIQITKGLIQADPIALLDFATDKSAASQTFINDIVNVIANDLLNCGLFSPMDPSVFPQKTARLDGKDILFDKWKTVGAHFAVSGTFMQSGSKIKLEFQLFDIVLQKPMSPTGYSIEGTTKNWRRVAHAVADLIYSRVTNDVGFFNTQIVYAETHGQGRKTTTQLKVMDYDGHGPRPLTNSKGLALTPRYAPNGKQIAYLNIYKSKAQVYVMDLATKNKHKLGDFEGMSFAPRYAPDGSNIVMSLAKHGKSAIYTMNLHNKQLKRLTDHISIDTSPCYSPDSTQITFTSDRAGKEHIYIMNSIGEDVRRISYGDAKYSQPVWSPRGDLIAFTKQIRSAEFGTRFYIGVMAPDGTGERMIADGWLVEDPCWAGNGRYLIFTKQESIKSPSKLFMVDLTGYNQRWISTAGNASNGTWSPLVAQVAAQ